MREIPRQRTPDFPFSVRVPATHLFYTSVFNADETHSRSAPSSPLTARKPRVPGWYVQHAQSKGPLSRCPRRHDLHRHQPFLFIVHRDCTLSARLRNYISFYRLSGEENLHKPELFQEQWEDKYTFKIVTNEEMSLICHANCELIHSRILKKFLFLS